MVLLLLPLLSLSSTNRFCLGLSIFISSVFSPRSHLGFPTSPSPRVFLSGFPLVLLSPPPLFFHSLFDVNYWSEQKGGDYMHSCKPGLLDWMRLSSTWFWLVQTQRAFARWFKRKGNTNTCKRVFLLDTFWVDGSSCSVTVIRLHLQTLLRDFTMQSKGLSKLSVQLQWLSSGFLKGCTHLRAARSAWMCSQITNLQYFWPLIPAQPLLFHLKPFAVFWPSGGRGYLAVLMWIKLLGH